MSLTMDMLTQEHRNMSRLLDILDHQVCQFEQAKQVDYDLVTQIVDYFRSFPDLYHHPKEDLVFQKLLERNPVQARAFANLESEHEECSNRLFIFARAVVSVLIETHIPREGFVRIARNFIDNERRHMSGEESWFFPTAMQYLTAEDWAEIDSRVSKLPDPLSELGRETPHRYDLVRAELARTTD